MSNWLKRAKEEGTPLIDGNTVIFVWKGKKAPYLHLESQNFQAVKMEKQSKNVWIYQTEIPLDAYIEYNYSTKKNMPKTIVSDPFNKRIFDTGLGWLNHYFSMPERQHTALIKRKKGIKRGTVSKHKIDHEGIVSGGKRNVWLYQPATEDPAPLLVVYDGNDYKKRGKIIQIVDNLIADEKIRPIALAMVQHGGEHRFMEYYQSEATIGLIGQYVLPLAHEHLNLLDIAKHPGAYGVMGASMGGIMALYTSLRLPFLFGHTISQAGAFFLGRLYEQPTLIRQLIEHMPVTPIKVWLDVGTFDFLLKDSQVMQKMLEEKAYDVSYREYSGGHNYTNWRDSLPEALISIFGV